MTPLTCSLQIIIQEIIAAKETELQVSLCIEDYDFLTKTNTEFITRNIHKYILGVKEHGPGFLTDVDHTDELYKELLDAVNFLAAIRLKQQKHDKRYNIT